MKKIVFTLLMLALLTSIGATALFAHDVAFRGAMRIANPLTDEGYVDFLKALERRFYPPELTTNDNGFRDIIRQFGSTAKHSSFRKLKRGQILV